MIRAAMLAFARERATLSTLLQAADDRLHPLREPFVFDFGLHRWLATAREEAYSDWLVWILERVDGATQLCALFGIVDPDFASTCGDVTPQIVREQQITAPDGTIGRLDVLIRFQSQALIVLELKVTRPEQAELAKQVAYAEWVALQPEAHMAKKVLIALPGDRSVYEGAFELITWSDIAIRIRRLVPNLTRSRRFVDASLALGFAAAIEQNLLELPGSVERVAATEAGVWRIPGVIDHLEAWLKEADFDG